MRVLSLGAGVQSSTLLLMACRGEIEKPDHAIFADTQWEPRAVYAHLELLKAEAFKAGIPVHIITHGSLKDEVRQSDAIRIPVFARMEPSGPVSMMQKQCTNEFKVFPIRRKIRELLGTVKSAECWIGISTDEIQRMKPSGKKWLTHRWPLIERRMRRNDCVNWLAKNGYPDPPKSACLGCPYHSNAGWKRIANSPDEWAETVQIDREIRSKSKIQGQIFLHKSGVPLDEAVFADDGQLDLFVNECEGMCGV